MKKAIFSWSGGKDSAMALHTLRQEGAYEIPALLTVITRDYGRISMHGIREELLDMQAESIGIPLEKIYITKSSTNDEYERNMAGALERHKSLGVETVGFGDIFLEDLKRYREERLAEAGMRGIFPIWKRDSRELANAFIDLGFKAVITCVDSKALDGKFAGRFYDKKLLSELPGTVDPCGENGEFHSFVYDGPIFKRGVNFNKGDTVLRDSRYYFTDLITNTTLISLVSSKGGT